MSHRSQQRFCPGLEALEARIPLSTLSLLAPGELRHLAPEVRVVTDTTGSAISFNRSRYPSERQGISPQDYPYLGQNYEVLAPSSGTYNCISYTLGLFNQWISQQMGPPQAPLSWMDHLYATEGYVRLHRMDTSLVPGERKVVLYGYTGKNGSVQQILHAELQDRDGTWSSKLGDGPLIRYPYVNSLAGPAYGHPIAVYARPVATHAHS